MELSLYRMQLFLVVTYYKFIKYKATNASDTKNIGGNAMQATINNMSQSIYIIIKISFPLTNPTKSQERIIK